MGATFDTKLLYRVGKLLSEEAKRKGVHVILAPTVCIQRSPLIGRGFEAFSDDPVLSGTLAAQYISGIQDHGVGSCIKHYAAHDQSIRGSQDAVVMSERTLREIHLLPFQLAFARGSSKPWSVMSSYNRINGVHCSEDPKLLNGVLRDEWGFDGLVMSDWWGTYSTSEALNAGLDLEMPGPSVFRGRALAEAVECRKVSLKAVDAAVRNLLQLINRTKAWDNSGPQAWTGTDTKESQALARKIAADSIVLLKNSKSILPLDKTKKQTYGLIGEHFLYPAVCGGGSSESEPFYISTPLEAMDEALSAGNFKYVPGHFSWRWTPLIRTGLTLPGSSDPGLLVEWFAEDPHHNPNAQAVRSEATKSTSMYFSQMAFPELPPTYFIRARSTFSSQNTGSYRFGLSVWGRAKLFVDGKKAIDQWTDHPEKTDQTPMFNKFTMERFFILSTEKGKQYSMEILLTNATGKPTVGLPGQGGVRLGGHELIDDDKAIEEAVELARNVDIPIVMVGLCSDYETEGQDRSDLHLPGRQNELVQKVAEANPNTVVVTQSGMPIQMPWLNSVTTLLHAWFGGQETGHGIVDVLFGAVNPSGRLSVTFPQCIEDTPTYLTFGKADKVLVYGEGVFVGHRYHEMVKRAPMFHFGYGLSYTRFEYSNLSAPSIFEAREDFVFKISLDIKNTGARDGDEVVQAYVADCQASVQRPVKELKAFTKAHIPVGEKRTVSFNLDKYAVSFWSEYVGKWYAEKGDFEIIIARSADPKDVVLRAAFKLADSFTWSGL